MARLETHAGIPAAGQVREFFQAGIVINRVMKAGDDRTAAVGHLVSQKLPGSVLSIV